MDTCIEESVIYVDLSVPNDNLSVKISPRVLQKKIFKSQSFFLIFYDYLPLTWSVKPVLWCKRLELLSCMQKVVYLNLVISGKSC